MSGGEDAPRGMKLTPAIWVLETLTAREMCDAMQDLSCIYAYIYLMECLYKHQWLGVQYIPLRTRAALSKHVTLEGDDIFLFQSCDLLVIYRVSSSNCFLSRPIMQPCAVFNLPWLREALEVKRSREWSAMWLKLENGFCIFAWLAVSLLILERVCARHAPPDCISVPWFIIHNCFLMQGAFFPIPLRFVLLMWWLHSPWAPHHTHTHTQLWSLRWGAQTQTVVWLSVPSRWLNGKRQVFIWSWSKCQLWNKV